MTANEGTTTGQAPAAEGIYSAPPSPPYMNRYFLVLQTAALFLLAILVYSDLYLLTTESSYIPYEEYMVYSREMYSIIGFILGFLFVLHSRLAFYARRRIKLVLLVFLLGCLIILILPLLETFLPFPLPPYLEELNAGILGFFESLLLYVGTIFLFSLVPIAGVYGIMLGNKRSIYLSLFSLLTVIMSIGNLDYFEDDIVSVFLDTSKYTIFSVLFLAYAELGLAISHFTERSNQVYKYDVRTTRFYESEGAFQMRYGMKLPEYPRNYAINQMAGVLLIFLPFLFLMIALSLSITLFSVNFDFLFSSVMTEAYQNSIVARTIFGKVFFVVFFFTLIVLVRGVVPSMTWGGKKIKQAAKKRKKKK